MPIDDSVASRHQLPVFINNHACLRTFRPPIVTFPARCQLRQHCSAVPPVHKCFFNYRFQALFDVITHQKRLDRGIIAIYGASKCNSEDASAETESIAMNEDSEFSSVIVLDLLQYQQ